jgi:hypothetical protein
MVVVVGALCCSMHSLTRCQDAIAACEAWKDVYATKKELHDAFSGKVGC